MGKLRSPEQRGRSSLVIVLWLVIAGGPKVIKSEIG